MMEDDLVGPLVERHGTLRELAGEILELLRVLEDVPAPEGYRTLDVYLRRELIVPVHRRPQVLHLGILLDPAVYVHLAVDLEERLGEAADEVFVPPVQDQSVDDPAELEDEPDTDAEGSAERVVPLHLAVELRLGETEIGRPVPELQVVVRGVVLDMEVEPQLPHARLSGERGAQLHVECEIQVEPGRDDRLPRSRDRDVGRPDLDLLP